MSIRLNKAIKEFNVGLQNIVDYLNANGGSLKGDPNEKINDEQYALLQKQFGADKALHDEAAKIFSKPEKPKKVEKAEEGEVKEKARKPKKERNDEEITEWSDVSDGGVSIADLLHKNDWDFPDKK